MFTVSTKIVSPPTRRGTSHFKPFYLHPNLKANNVYCVKNRYYTSILYTPFCERIDSQYHPLYLYTYNIFDRCNDSCDRFIEMMVCFLHVDSTVTVKTFYSGVSIINCTYLVKVLRLKYVFPDNTYVDR